MAGSRIGGLKAAATNKARHGENFYKEVGRKGGLNGHTGGFFGNSEFARICGKKGGRASSRKGIKNGEGKRYDYRPH